LEYTFGPCIISSFVGLDSSSSLNVLVGEGVSCVWYTYVDVLSSSDDPVSPSSTFSACLFIY